MDRFFKAEPKIRAISLFQSLVARVPQPSLQNSWEIGVRFAKTPGIPHQIRFLGHADTIEAVFGTVASELDNVAEAPITRATLLLRLRNAGDADAWSDFIRDYGPMLYRFVRSRGLQDADAADLVQDVLRSVGMAIGRLEYQKEKGGFRAWLFTITRNKLYTYFERRQRAGPTGNDTAQFELLNQATDRRSPLDEQWELEHQRQLVAKAVERMKPQIEPKTWAAFELTAIDGLSAVEAGKRLGMKSGAIYVARSRVTAKLRTEVERLMEEE